MQTKCGENVTVFYFYGFELLQVAMGIFDPKRRGEVEFFSINVIIFSPAVKSNEIIMDECTF